MEIINNFGIDPKLLFAQVVNFLIILFVLKRFLYKPILALLDKRKRVIEEGVQKTEEARIQLEKASEKELVMLKKAESTAKKLLDEAKNQRVLLLKETEDATKKQADKILAEAREQIAFEAKAVEKKLSAHVSELAVQFLEKSLSGIFSENQQHKIVKQAVKQIKQKTN